MHVQEAIQGGSWSDLVRRRLSRSLALSAILLGAMLSLIRIQFEATYSPDEGPVLEITLPLPAEQLPLPQDVTTEEPPSDEEDFEGIEATEAAPDTASKARTRSMMRRGWCKKSRRCAFSAMWMAR
jgi:hypothetical protein